MSRELFQQLFFSIIQASKAYELSETFKSNKVAKQSFKTFALFKASNALNSTFSTTSCSLHL
jgi:hypothetical protein